MRSAPARWKRRLAQRSSAAEPTDYRQLAREMLNHPERAHVIYAPNGTKYRWSYGALQWELQEDTWREVNPGWGIENIGHPHNLGSIMMMLSAIEAGVDFRLLHCGNRIITTGSY